MAERVHDGCKYGCKWGANPPLARDLKFFSVCGYRNINGLTALTPSFPAPLAPVHPGVGVQGCREYRNHARPGEESSGATETVGSGFPRPSPRLIRRIQCGRA